MINSLCKLLMTRLVYVLDHVHDTLLVQNDLQKSLFEANTPLIQVLNVLVNISDDFFVLSCQSYETDFDNILLSLIDERVTEKSSVSSFHLNACICDRPSN